MKKNRTYLFIAISSIALIVVLIIQVNWILQTAKIKAEIFNEKANMVLSRTTDELCSDKETCMRIGSCIETDSSNSITARLADNDMHKIDSLFNHYMKYYNLHIDYTFVFVKNDVAKANKSFAFMSNTFCKSIDEATNINGLELKLILPQKRQFIIAEMGTMFISSVVLILIVLVLFWRTVLSLLKEKMISEHTTEFLNNMTHEFKTPLSNIALAGKLMTKDVNIKQEEKIKHYSDIILEENRKLSTQVEQVLSMTALERGEIPLQKSMINFNHLVSDAAKRMTLLVEEHNGKLQLELNATDENVYADQFHLGNAITNLIDNALKYANDKADISIQTKNMNHTIVFVISDKGIGIDKTYQAKVFDKFFRVPTGNIHDVKGFGLGLSYTKKIIELHQGTITLESKKGEGTTFIITLPNA